MSELSASRRPPPGAYLLPNLLTTAALFAGFYAIIAGFRGEYVPAAVAILVAAVFDGLDGRVARLTNTQSEFGVQFDSLADLVSFGLAPALLAYSWSLSGLRGYGEFWGKLGWLLAFVYVACAALRLARFNTQVGVADKRYFQGLASPAAACTLAALVWALEDLKPQTGLGGAELVIVVGPLTLALGLLMFSNFRYLSFKHLPWMHGQRPPLRVLLIAMLIVVGLALDPPRLLLLVGIGYVLSGPVLTLVQRRSLSARRGRRAGPNGP